MTATVLLSCHHAVGHVTTACAMPSARKQHVQTRSPQSMSAGSGSSQPSVHHTCSLPHRHGCCLQHAPVNWTSRALPRRTSITASGGGRGGDDNDSQPGPLLPERWKLYAALIAAATLAATVLTYSGDSIQVTNLCCRPCHWRYPTSFDGVLLLAASPARCLRASLRAASAEYRITLKHYRTPCMGTAST